MRLNNKDQGIALIQVLLVTAVLSVLALFMTQTAKNQVSQAQWVNDKAQAQVELYSAEALLLFELLTQKKIKSPQMSESVTGDIASRWNFFAMPFSLKDGVEVKIQDQSGLLQLHYPDSGLLKKLVATVEPSPAKVEIIVDSIMDWQDLDNTLRANGAEAGKYSSKGLIRNGAVPSVYDIKHVKSITPAVLELLKENTTIYQAGAFSPINAPEGLLNALMDLNTVEQVLSLRRSNQMTNNLFSDITGIVEDDDTYFYTSNYLMIDLVSEIGESKVNRKLFIHLQPYAEADKKPINIFLSRG
ncbi:general secretion pathway protein GspK [Thalassomonas haliotis]|uniref:Type II secretion system protein K n=1 Tax=Thalassomonas haliotis TaxID=485448 RepID=A0ABY7VK20_9GAMM|nr:type II secretion system protein GspK [Thalassomonas haliotis]WDE13268.1 general secretion pathway protein GspK [Thalassomonas haliotis]